MRRGALRAAAGAIAGLLLGTIAVGAPPAGAEATGLRPVVRANLYEVGSKRQNLLYHWTFSMDRDGEQRQMTFVNPKGELAAIERVKLEAGRFLEYTIVHPEADREGRIRRVGDRVEFSYRANGDTRRDAAAWTPDFVVGPLIVPYIQERWSRLQRGEKLEVRLAIPDRLRTLGFEIFRDASVRRDDGEPAVVVKMEPRNFLLARLVSPAYFTFSEDGLVLYQFTGRIAPLRLVEGSWKPTDVEGILHWEDP